MKLIFVDKHVEDTRQIAQINYYILLFYEFK